MVISVKNYVWEESETQLLIHVPWKNPSLSKVDIFISSLYLKISETPFLFEVSLKSPVRTNDSHVVLGNESIKLNFEKLHKGFWGSLSKDLSKDEMMALRNEAYKEVEKDITLKQEKKKEVKNELKSVAVRSHMGFEETLRNEIRNNKENVKLLMMNEFSKLNLEEKDRKLSNNYWKERSDVPKYPNLLSRDKKKTELPPVRNQDESSQIFIDFTPRELPTAARESRKADEEQWAQNIAKMKRWVAEGIEGDDPKYGNPDWLKEKGDSLFKQHQYQGAVSAYNLAIQLNPVTPSLYCNRSACHLAMKNFVAAIDDAEKGLSLLLPAVPDNAAQRAKCLARKGTALFKLGNYGDALQHLTSAHQLLPDNASLLKDIENVRRFIQSC